MTGNTIGENVVVRTSAGESCLVCDVSIKGGERVVSVTVRIPLGFFSTRLERAMHLTCARELRARLDQCLKEATRAKGR